MLLLKARTSQITRYRATLRNTHAKEQNRESTKGYSPVGTPGFKSRIRPPYPQRVVKGD